MKEIRNGKRMNFKRIYVQMAKHGKTVPELASEYGMDETDFVNRIEKGLEPKLFSSAMKANERNLKKQKDNDLKDSSSTDNKTPDSKQEEEEMTKGMEKKVEQNQRRKSVRNATKKEATISEKMSSLEEKRKATNNELLRVRSELEKTNEIIGIKKETVAKTQKVLEEAKKALEEANDDLFKTMEEQEELDAKVQKLADSMEKIENQIVELQSNTIYLIAPGYNGKVPNLGTYFSTTPVEGVKMVSVIEASAEYAINPELTDMLVAGYDSYSEYSNALRFVMLCMQYTANKVEYIVLNSDERLQKLITTHVK